MYIFKQWWWSLRPFSFTASLIPMILALIVSLQQTKSLDIIGFILTLSTGITIHIIANVFNSYYDWQFGHDQPGDPQVVPVLLNPALGAPALWRFGIVFLILGGILTLILGLLYGIIVFFISLLGIAGAYFYTAPPITYKDKGWALPAVFLFMGILMPVNTFLVQTIAFDVIIIFYATPLALLVTALLQANELRDYESDKNNNIRSLTVVAGSEVGLAVYKLLIYLPYLLTLTFCILAIFPSSSLLVLFTFAKAKNLVEEATKSKLERLDIKTAQLHGLFGIIYILCLVLT